MYNGRHWLDKCDVFVYPRSFTIWFLSYLVQAMPVGVVQFHGILYVSAVVYQWFRARQKQMSSVGDMAGKQT